MATLDRVIELQKTGISEDQIITQLRNEGISPKEIDDSLNQAKIKSAVSPQENITQEMQPSIMQESSQQSPAAYSQEPTPITQEPTPITQEQQTPEMRPTIQENQEPYQDYYQSTPQAYSGQEYYMSQGAVDTETISEIAEQVSSEKINELKKQIGDVSSFKNLTQDKLADLDERLKRIEASIDKLGQAVMGKIGEFGESSALIHKDLENLHGTVSKLMNPLIDKANEFKKKSKK
tara:strand:+ start:13792 stop:14496 length:705 start_codon:yes stop_codon:yes gene_type:complete